MKTPSARKRNAIEFGVNMGLQFPRFLLPFRTQRWQSIQMPRTRLEFGIISRIALIIGVPFPAWLGDIRGAI